MICWLPFEVASGAVAGVVLPLLQQTILLWQVSLGYLVLGKKLSPWEVRTALACHSSSGLPQTCPASNTELLVMSVQAGASQQHGHQCATISLPNVNDLVKRIGCLDSPIFLSPSTLCAYARLLVLADAMCTRLWKQCLCLYSQMAGAALVVAGVCTAAWPSGGGPSVFAEVKHPPVALPLHVTSACGHFFRFNIF